jgi:hypothetical protein
MSEIDEREQLLDAVFPVGGERWIKVKYLDRDKAIKAFHINGSPEHAAELGYEVVTLAIVPEFQPPRDLLLDLKDKLADVHDTIQRALNGLG